MPWLYKVGQILIWPILKVYNRTGVTGRKNVPRKGGVILASNHSSYWDILILCASMWRTLHYLAKSELFKTRLTNFFFTSVGQIKVERGKGDKRALVNAVEALKKGKTIVFFPEGTTVGGRELGRGHTGVARVALRARVPIVPVAILNTWRIFPRGSKMPKPLKARIKFGKPICLEEFYGKEDDREVTRMITDRIMGEIAKLADLDYDPK